ncbi:MAG: endonuclease/exonuclease/phosphatase family protein [Oligoflexia bacterium]|nr:endonuclease/exonuclease/phosphatase family protein [Oligoflexia bacterium]
MLLKLLQWNVWYLEKLQRVEQFLKSVDADILCLQELATNTKANPGIATGSELARRLGYYSHIEAAQRWVGFERDSQENGILSKFPFLSTRSVFVSPPGDPDIRDYGKEGRVYVEGVVDVEGTKLTIGTTHLTFAPRFEVTEAKRKEEAVLLSNLGDQPNFIFAGDLNSVPSSPIVAELCSRFVSCGPPFSRNTWTTKDFDYQGFKETALNWRLDYVFASRNIKVCSSKILDTNVSDHLPILVEFEIDTAGL